MVLLGSSNSEEAGQQDDNGQNSKTKRRVTNTTIPSNIHENTLLSLRLLDVIWNHIEQDFGNNTPYFDSSRLRLSAPVGGLLKGRKLTV